MNALTILQPYAALICLPDDHDRAKRVENRTWAAPQHAIGKRLAIHAGKSTRLIDEDDDRPGFDLYGLEIDKMPVGAFVATATLAGCVELNFHYNSTRADRIPEWACNRWPWLECHEHVEGPYCWVLTDVVPLAKPIPWPGRQGLWMVPDDVLTKGA